MNQKGLYLNTGDDDASSSYWNQRESQTPAGILKQMDSRNYLLASPHVNIGNSFLKLSPNSTLTGRARKGAFFPNERSKRNDSNSNGVFLEDVGNSEMDQ